MSTNSAFKLSKTAKRTAARILDKHLRKQFLNLMITAESAAASAKNRKFVDPASSQKSGKAPAAE